MFPKRECVRFSFVIQPYTECSILTWLKKRCPEVGCPFPTSSPFQQLEIPLCTKRADFIPQHWRQGRELGTILIRQAPLSGKILKGMQPIVVNCMGPHSIPSASGMWYLSWIGQTHQCLFCSCELWLVCGLQSFYLFIFFFHLAGVVSIVWSSCVTPSYVLIAQRVTAGLTVHFHTRLTLILPAGSGAFTHL